MWPGGGRDLLRGRGGRDTVRYDGRWSIPAPSRGIHVDLAAGEARGQGFDRLFSIGNAIGTAEFANVLLGNEWANNLSGGGKADIIRGRGGGDFLSGAGGKDRLYGGPGRDGIDGGGARDVAYGNGGDDRFFMNEEYGGLSILRRDVLWGGRGSDWAEIDYLDRLHSIEHAPPRD